MKATKSMTKKLNLVESRKYVNFIELNRNASNQRTFFLSFFLISIITVAIIITISILVIQLPTSFAAMIAVNISKFTDLNGGTIQLSSTDNRTVMCFGNASSTTGVTGANATFYGPSSNYKTAPAAGTAYRNTTCTIVGTTAATFNCTTTLHHHAEPGNWSCLIVARDAAGNRNATTNNSIDTFMSISLITTKLNFSKTAMGGTTGTTDYLVQFNNTGNMAFRIQMDAYRVSGVPADANALACTIGTVPIANLKYATLAGQDATVKTSLTDTPITTATNYTPTAFGSTAYTNGTLYYGLTIPASGPIQGACGGFLSIAAVP